jgi:hypothetical protein
MSELQYPLTTTTPTFSAEYKSLNKLTLVVECRELTIELLNPLEEFIQYVCFRFQAVKPKS